MGDFLDNHIEDILAGMPSPKEIIQQELEEEIKFKLFKSSKI